MVLMNKQNRRAEKVTNEIIFLPVNANSSSYSWLCNIDAGIFANIFTNPIQKPQNANTYCRSVNRSEDTECSVQLQARERTRRQLSSLSCC